MTHYHIGWLLTVAAMCVTAVSLVFNAEPARVGAALAIEFAIVILIARASNVGEVKS